MSVASKRDISQKLKADLALSPTPFFLLTTFVARLHGGVMAGAFVSPGDLALCRQLAQVALTSAMGLDWTGRAEVRPSPSGARLGATAQPQLGIWVMVSCSGRRAGPHLLKRG